MEVVRAVAEKLGLENTDDDWLSVNFDTIFFTQITKIGKQRLRWIVFESLFGEGGSIAERRIALRKRASLLDSFIEDIARLQRTLAPGDRAKVNDYVESVRELERRIQDTFKAPPDAARQLGVGEVFVIAEGRAHWQGWQLDRRGCATKWLENTNGGPEQSGPAAGSVFLELD